LLTQYTHSWPEIAPTASCPAADCRILAITDVPAVRQALDGCLSGKTYRDIRFAMNLAEAAQLSVDGKLWDLVLVVCPDGHDVNALRNFRQETGLWRAAILAVVPGPDDLRHAIDAGADDALAMPVDRETLDLHIAHALEHRSLRNAVDQYWIATAQEHDQDLARFVFDAAPDALLLLEPDGAILTANPAAEELLQCEAAMLTGSPIGAFLNGLADSPDGEPRIDHLLAQLSAAHSRPVETVIHCLNGKVQTVEVFGRTVKRLGRQALVIALRDISHRMPQPASSSGDRADTPAHHAATMRLLAQLSTELMAPLDEIVNCAEVIQQQALGPLGVPLYHSYAADIQQSSRALLKLVERLMEMTKGASSAS